MKKRLSKKILAGNARYFLRETVSMLGAKSALAAFSTMMLILLSVALTSAYIIFEKYSQKLAAEAEIAVFYSEVISPEKLSADLEKKPGVVEVTQVSREEAYEEMKGYLGSEAALLERLEENPFQPYLRVRVELGVSDFELENIRNTPFVTHVRDNRDILNKIDSITGALAFVGLTVVIISVLTSAFITYYVSVENIALRSEQVENLLYMGAPYGFIVKPFVLSSLIVNVAASIPCIIASVYVWNVVDAGVQVNIPFVCCAISMLIVVTGIAATHFSARGFRRQAFSGIRAKQ